MHKHIYSNASTWINPFIPGCIGASEEVTKWGYSMRSYWKNKNIVGKVASHLFSVISSANQTS